MRRHLVRDGAEIGRIMEYLVDRGTDVEVCVEGRREKYVSRLHAVRAGETADGRALMLDGLVPEGGDLALARSREVEIAFWMDRYLCRFHAAYLRKATEVAPQGHVIHYPLYVELEERRLEDRFTLSFPHYCSAVLTVPQEDQSTVSVESTVLNYSRHGLGLLVKKWDFPLLKHVRPGDTIPDIILYGEGLLVNLSGTLRHKTEIMVGTYSGHYVLGIESEMDLENHFQGVRPLAA